MVANWRQSSIGQGQTSSSFRFRAGGIRPQPAASERHGRTKSWLELFKFAASADLAKTHQQYSTLAQQSENRPRLDRQTLQEHERAHERSLVRSCPIIRAHEEEHH